MRATSILATLDELGKLHRPLRQFEISQVVGVPTAVCESGRARIVGTEWKVDSWQYWLIEVELVASNRPGPLPVEYVSKGRSPWAASESELIKWKG